MKYQQQSQAQLMHQDVFEQLMHGQSRLDPSRDNLLNQVQLRRYLYDWQQNSQSSGHLDPSTEQFIQAKWLSGHEKKLSTAAEHPRALHPSLSFTDRT